MAEEEQGADQPEPVDAAGQLINELLRKPHMSDYQVIVMAASNLPGTDWAHNVKVATEMLAMAAAAITAGKFYDLYAKELETRGIKEKK